MGLYHLEYLNGTSIDNELVQMFSLMVPQKPGSKLGPESLFSSCSLHPEKVCLAKGLSGE